GGTRASAVELHDVVAARVDRLSETERTLLEIVALAGAPINAALAADAADLGRSWTPVAAVLHKTCLVRYGIGTGAALLEPYHDRIRESVVAALPTETRRAHHRA